LVKALAVTQLAVPRPVVLLEAAETLATAVLLVLLVQPATVVPAMIPARGSTWKWNPSQDPHLSPTPPGTRPWWSTTSMAPARRLS
ncbi:hypothetical protein JXD20_00565, partial [Candidatus Peregrinibacteria bacterium]|nr:hypothetical protein [Candidatus Peregrinibacteria bacterium]